MSHPVHRAIAALLLAAASAFAQNAADTLRPEVATPARAAIDALKAGRFDEALAKVREAESVANRTPYENFVLDQVRGGAAAGAGDIPTAARSYEAALATGRLPPAEALPIIEGLVGAAYRAKDYERSANWARRYLADGGTNPNVRRTLANALYQRNDWAGTAKELEILVGDDEKAGRRPAEDQLRLLGASQAKLKDDAGYGSTLERLLRWHPKPAYWRDRIARLQRDAGFDDALLIDSYRLLLATGAMEDAGEFTSAAELAMRATLPAEAQKVLDAAAAAGKLAADAATLRQKATLDAAADAKELKAAPPPPASTNGNALVANGLAQASVGNVERAVALIEQGLAKGVARPDATRLRLAWVQLQAGRNEPARAILKDLQGRPGGLGDLARLWLIHLDRPPS